MRARRLCERKSKGKLHIPEDIHQEYVDGGEKREILELALLQCIAKYGPDRKHYKKIRVPHLHFFQLKVVLHCMF